MKRVLVVGCDGDTESVRAALVGSYETDAARTAKEAAVLVIRRGYDCVVIAGGLNDAPAADLCNGIKKHDGTPVLAIASGSSAFELYEMGADCCAAPGCGQLEVRARVEAMTRDALRSGTLMASGIEMNTETHVVESDGSVVGLTRTEFEVLRVLMERAGTPVSQSTIIDCVWDSASKPGKAALKVHISNIRCKVGKWKVVHIAGNGYMVPR